MNDTAVLNLHNHNEGRRLAKETEADTSHLAKYIFSNREYAINRTCSNEQIAHYIGRNSRLFTNLSIAY